MDSKINADNQWYASPLIELKQFLEDAWSADVKLRNVLGRPPVDSIVKEEDYHLAQLSKDFVSLTNCSHATSRNIFEKDLLISNLLPDDIDPKKDREFEVLNNKKDLKPNLLRCHFNAVQRNQYCRNPQKKSNYLRTLKYDRVEKSEIGLAQEMPEWYKPCEKDIIILVTVVVPYNKILTPEEMRSSRILSPQTKFMMRGESTLMSLRKKLACVSDMIVPLEDGRELDPPDMSKSYMVQYPSSFIFIHNTFYIDYSMENSQDISLPIREFMAKKNCFDEVFSKDMDGVKIIDLKLRLGQPYVFQHSGTCEHLIIFHDLRIMHKSDIQELERYPLLVYEKGGDIRCAACKMNFATFVVEACERLPSASMMFCDSCFKEFHFPHGVKMGNFRANPYFQMNRLTFV